MPGAALVLAFSLAHARPALAPPRRMLVVAAPNMEVMIARRSDDGSLETACVDNEEAAKAFFARPRTKSSKPEEQ